ncbi:MAG: hypothetical protein AB7I38_04770 [Dehalococcoidia bacterium]
MQAELQRLGGASRESALPAASKWPRRVALGSLLAWGAMHVGGGAVLIATAQSEGGRAGLELLGSRAGATDFPSDAGPVTEAVLAFHGLNLLLAGAAVVVLTLFLARVAWPRGVSTAFGLIAAADLGLIVFLLAPGYMSPLDGVWGPLLFAVALLAAWAAGWRPRQL